MMKFEWEKFWKQNNLSEGRWGFDWAETDAFWVGNRMVEWLNHEDQEIFVTIIVDYYDDEEEEEEDYGSSLFSIDRLISVSNRF